MKNLHDYTIEPYYTQNESRQKKKKNRGVLNSGVIWCNWCNRTKDTRTCSKGGGDGRQDAYGINANKKLKSQISNNNNKIERDLTKPKAIRISYGK